MSESHSPRQETGQANSHKEYRIKKREKAEPRHITERKTENFKHEAATSGKLEDSNRNHHTVTKCKVPTLVHSDTRLTSNRKSPNSKTHTDGDSPLPSVTIQAFSGSRRSSPITLYFPDRRREVSKRSISTSPTSRADRENDTKQELVHDEIQNLHHTTANRRDHHMVEAFDFHTKHQKYFQGEKVEIRNIQREKSGDRVDQTAVVVPRKHVKQRSFSGFTSPSREGISHAFKGSTNAVPRDHETYVVGRSTALDDELLFQRGQNVSSPRHRDKNDVVASKKRRSMPGSEFSHQSETERPSTAFKDTNYALSKGDEHSNVGITNIYSYPDETSKFSGDRRSPKSVRVRSTTGVDFNEIAAVFSQPSVKKQRSFPGLNSGHLHETQRPHRTSGETYYALPEDTRLVIPKVYRDPDRTLDSHRKRTLSSPRSREVGVQDQEHLSCTGPGTLGSPIWGTRVIPKPDLKTSTAYPHKLETQGSFLGPISSLLDETGKAPTTFSPTYYARSCDNKVARADSNKIYNDALDYHKKQSLSSEHPRHQNKNPKIEYQVDKTPTFVRQHSVRQQPSSEISDRTERTPRDVFNKTEKTRAGFSNAYRNPDGPLDFYRKQSLSPPRNRPELTGLFRSPTCEIPVHSIREQSWSPPSIQQMNSKRGDHKQKTACADSKSTLSRQRSFPGNQRSTSPDGRKEKSRIDDYVPSTAPGLLRSPISDATVLPQRCQKTVPQTSVKGRVPPDTKTDTATETGRTPRLFKETTYFLSSGDDDIGVGTSDVYKRLGQDMGFYSKQKMSALKIQEQNPKANILVPQKLVTNKATTRSTSSFLLESERTPDAFKETGYTAPIEDKDARTGSSQAYYCLNENQYEKRKRSSSTPGNRKATPKSEDHKNERATVVSQIPKKQRSFSGLLSTFFEKTERTSEYPEEDTSALSSDDKYQYTDKTLELRSEQGFSSPRNQRHTLKSGGHIENIASAVPSAVLTQNLSPNGKRRFMDKTEPSPKTFDESTRALPRDSSGVTLKRYENLDKEQDLHRKQSLSSPRSPRPSSSGDYEDKTDFAGSKPDMPEQGPKAFRETSHGLSEDDENERAVNFKFDEDSEKTMDIPTNQSLSSPREQRNSSDNGGYRNKVDTQVSEKSMPTTFQKFEPTSDALQPTSYVLSKDDEETSMGVSGTYNELVEKLDSPGKQRLSLSGDPLESFKCGDHTDKSPTPQEPVNQKTFAEWKFELMKERTFGTSKLASYAVTTNTSVGTLDTYPILDETSDLHGENFLSTPRTEKENLKSRVWDEQSDTDGSKRTVKYKPSFGSKLGLLVEAEETPKPIKETKFSEDESADNLNPYKNFDETLAFHRRKSLSLQVNQQEVTARSFFEDEDDHFSSYLVEKELPDAGSHVPNRKLVYTNPTFEKNLDSNHQPNDTARFHKRASLVTNLVHKKEPTKRLTASSDTTPQIRSFDLINNDLFERKITDRKKDQERVFLPLPIPSSGVILDPRKALAAAGWVKSHPNDPINKRSRSARLSRKKSSMKQEASTSLRPPSKQEVEVSQPSSSKIGTLVSAASANPKKILTVKFDRKLDQTQRSADVLWSRSSDVDPAKTWDDQAKILSMTEIDDTDIPSASGSPKESTQADHETSAVKKPSQVVLGTPRRFSDLHPSNERTYGLSEIVSPPCTPLNQGANVASGVSKTPTKSLKGELDGKLDGEHKLDDNLWSQSVDVDPAKLWDDQARKLSMSINDCTIASSTMMKPRKSTHMKQEAVAYPNKSSEDKVGKQARQEEDRIHQLGHRNLDVLSDVKHQFRKFGSRGTGSPTITSLNHFRSGSDTFNKALEGTLKSTIDQEQTGTDNLWSQSLDVDPAKIWYDKERKLYTKESTKTYTPPARSSRKYTHTKQDALAFPKKPSEVIVEKAKRQTRRISDLIHQLGDLLHLLSERKLSSNKSASPSRSSMDKTQSTGSAAPSSPRKSLQNKLDRDQTTAEFSGSPGLFIDPPQVWEDQARKLSVTERDHTKLRSPSPGITSGESSSHDTASTQRFSYSSDGDSGTASSFGDQPSHNKLDSFFEKRDQDPGTMGDDSIATVLGGIGLNIDTYAEMNFSRQPRGFWPLSIWRKMSLDMILTYTKARQHPCAPVSSWKDPIKQPLLKTLAGDLKWRALVVFARNFELSDGIHGDVPSDRDRTWHIHQVLSAAIGYRALRDEVFCQIIKQTTANPSRMSNRKGWQAMAICCGMFLPSDDFHPYLDGHLQQVASGNIARQGRADELGMLTDGMVNPKEAAAYALSRLRKLKKLGPRRLLPLPFEIRVVEIMDTVPYQVLLPDGTWQAFIMDPLDTAEEVVKHLIDLLGLFDPQSFGLFEVEPNGVEKLIASNAYVVDVMAASNPRASTPRDVEDIRFYARVLDKCMRLICVKPQAEEGEETEEDKDRPEPGEEETEKNQMLLKRKLHLVDSLGVPEDLRMVMLKFEYSQAVHDIVHGVHRISEGDAMVLGAMQLRADLGRSEVDPEVLAGIDGNKYGPDYFVQGNEGAWKDAISTTLASLSHNSNPTTWRQDYIDYVISRCPLYEACMFFVKPLYNPTMPEKMFLAVSSTGISFVDANTKESLNFLEYAEIASWGYTPILFSIIVGNMIISSDAQFQTNQGLEISKIIQLNVDIIQKMHKKLPKEEVEDDDESEKGLWD